jgi:thiol-disulfide isomerase/thioredoxin
MVKKFALVALAIIVLSLGVRLVLPQEPTVSAPGNFVLRNAPAAVPALEFTDGEGQKRTLADFRGKVVLLNIWATWCAPCRKEIPTLDRLQAALGGDDFEIVPLSIDRGGAERVKKFYDEIGVQHLGIYVDSSRTANNALDVFGLPATLLIDRQGRELGRLSGAAEWDAPDMIAFLKSTIAKKESRLADPQQKGHLS